MSQLCAWYGISRQAHYQMVRRQAGQQDQETRVLDLVRAVRHRHPRLGGRKLLHLLQPRLEEAGIGLGRDRFFDLLARHDLLVPSRRRRRRTTWPGPWRCPNLLHELTILRGQQVWVCDITYLETEDDFCYLCLLTDAHSRFIVGYDVAASLAAEGALRALEMGIDQAQPPLAGLIHHSDHGVQYTCHPYRDRLQRHLIRPSMGQVGNCYDNAQAERVNGILQLEYGLGEVLPNIRQARRLTAETVYLYNYERPHLALNYQTPIVVHRH